MVISNERIEEALKNYLDIEDISSDMYVLIQNILVVDKPSDKDISIAYVTYLQEVLEETTRYSL